MESQHMPALICVLVLLVLNTLTDLRYRKIWIFPCLVLSAAGILFSLVQNGWSAIVWMRLLGGAFPGLVLLCCSLIWKEAVGAGDGLTILTAGLWMGQILVLELLFTGLFLLSCFCIVLLLFRKAGKKTQVPFMPFLLAAQILLMACG